MNAKPADRRLTWILLGSILVGITASFVLALFAFAGGTESTITGALMLGDGLGWALIALLTTRYSDHPQKWAWVPAVGMTTFGLSLGVLQPGIGAMNSLSWAWPPVLLAFVTWMWRTTRRVSVPRGRWVINVVIVFYIVCSVGTTYENITDHRDRNTYAAPGKMYEVNGHHLHLSCTGHGRPTVVLENGLGEFSASWTRIVSGVTPTTRVCAFDRAGQGWSESVGPQSPDDAVKDLHDVLNAAGEKGPYVLAGHSTGGTYAMAYATEHLTDVAGLVLLDSATPEQFTALSEYSSQYSAMRRGLALVPTFARFGVARIVSASVGSELPGRAGDEVTATASTARAASNMRDEISVLPELFKTAQGLTTLSGRPLVVTTASGSLSTKGWEQAQAKMTELSINRLHRTVEASHAGLLEEADGARQSIRAIVDVVDAFRRNIPMVCTSRSWSEQLQRHIGTRQCAAPTTSLR